MPKHFWEDGTPIKNYDVIVSPRGALVVLDDDASYEVAEGIDFEGVLCVPARIVTEEPKANEGAEQDVF